MSMQNLSPGTSTPTSTESVPCRFCGRDASGPLAASIDVDGVVHPFCCKDHAVLWVTSLQHRISAPR